MTSVGKGRGARKLSNAKLEKPRPMRPVLRSISCPQVLTTLDYDVCHISYGEHSPWGCSSISDSQEHITPEPVISATNTDIQQHGIHEEKESDHTANIEEELLTENRVGDDWESESIQSPGFVFGANQMSKTSVFVNQSRPKVVRHNSVDSSEVRPRKFRPISLPYIVVRAAELEQHCIDEQRQIEEELEHLSMADDDRGHFHNDDVFLGESRSNVNTRKASSDFSDSGCSLQSSESKEKMIYSRKELINLASSPASHQMPDEWTWLSQVMPDVCQTKVYFGYFDPEEYLRRDVLQSMYFSMYCQFINKF